MTYVKYHLQHHIGVITLNRPEKYNAFDDGMIASIHTVLDTAISDPNAYVLILRGEGKHFSSGADLAWMQRMVHASQEDNHRDARVLADLMYKIYRCPKPTICMVQGRVFGGGIGLVAACDIAFGSDNTEFCFSEVKLGLVPAVISPFVIQAVGPRVARALFLSAEVFDAVYAESIGLLYRIVSAAQLETYVMDYAHYLATLPQGALKSVKTLIQDVQGCTMDEKILDLTSGYIAERRISHEAQDALKKFLEKKR